MTRIFLDANVYFSGFYSDRGASYLLMELVERKKIQVYASRLVLREAERNLRSKAAPETLKVFHRFLQNTKIHIVFPSDDKRFKTYEELIHPKDFPVLSAALTARVEYLVTLDRKHFLTPSLQKIKEFKILTPGDFLTCVFLKGKC